MPSASDTIDAALKELGRLSTVLAKSKTPQVRSADERGLAKATALAWFHEHRPALASLSFADSYEKTDAGYKAILEASDMRRTRSSYRALLKGLRTSLIALRSESVSAPAEQPSTTNQPPSFAPLIPNQQMQHILESRWIECVSCLSAQAPLSAMVMMGGLLEALLLARVNRESNLAPVFTAKAAPRDKTGKTKGLQEWMLNDYIEVAHELKWISVSARSVGAVLRDYRNYVHPHKQLSHNVNLSMDDSSLLWEVSKGIARQVIASS